MLSPDVSKLTLIWRTKPGVHRGMFERLLLMYRSEVSFKQVGKNDWTVLPPGKGFLTDEERRNESAPLSFELVLQAYRHEYARRYAAYVKAGGVAWPVKAPQLSTPQQQSPDAPRVIRIAPLLPQSDCESLR